MPISKQHVFTKSSNIYNNFSEGNELKQNFRYKLGPQWNVCTHIPPVMKYKTLQNTTNETEVK